jgi:uncharacterized protein YjbI with pentapeptide repeats
MSTRMQPPARSGSDNGERAMSEHSINRVLLAIEENLRNKESACAGIRVETRGDLDRIIAKLRRKQMEKNEVAGAPSSEGSPVHDDLPSSEIAHSVDISGIDLNAVDLSDMDLTHVVLRGAKLQNVNMSSVFARGVDLSEADLTGANLKHAFIESAIMCRARLDNADLTDAILDMAILRNARLVEADLTRAYLRSATLWAANLTRAKLPYAFLAQSDLSDAQLFGTDLHGAILKKANMQRSVLENANLSEATLHDAHLEGARLMNTDLRAARLTGVTFDSTTRMSKVIIGRRNTEFGRITWQGVQLADVNWGQIRRLGNESRSERKPFRNGERLLIHPRPSKAYFWASKRVTLLRYLRADQQPSASSELPLSLLGNWFRARVGLDRQAFDSAIRAQRRAAYSSSVEHGKIVQGGRVVSPADQGRFADVQRAKRRLEDREAAQAYRNLATALANQALPSAASYFRLREHIMERKAAFHDHRWMSWAFSWLLFLISGYGERPIYTFITYLSVVCTFIGAYVSVASLIGLQGIPLSDWVILGFTAFHGRGFLPKLLPTAGTTVEPNVWILTLAMLEAIIGVFIESIFIATFSRRFVTGQASSG